jgi:hypothetical protein
MAERRLKAGGDGLLHTARSESTAPIDTMSSLTLEAARRYFRRR